MTAAYCAYAVRDGNKIVEIWEVESFDADVHLSRQVPEPTPFVAALVPVLPYLL